MVEPSQKIYYRGHWGWQWYARGTMMREYDRKRTALQVGDLLVDPVGVHSQRVPKTYEFEILEVIEEPVGPFNILDTLPLYIMSNLAEPYFRLNPGREIRILRRTR